MRISRYLIGVFLLSALLSACSAPGQPQVQAVETGLAATLSALPSLAPTSTPAQPPTATAEPTQTATATLAPSPTPTPAPVILAGAGDISACGLEGHRQTAALLDEIQPDIVFGAGDNSYGHESYLPFPACFDETWGRYRDRYFPALGNHEYEFEPDAGSYFAYFGERAGPRGKGYYSYDVGEWHVVVLNSNCLNMRDDACGPSAPQVQWLREDLERSTARCTLAYWHHPRFSSGLAGSSFWLDAFWQVLYEHGAEVVIGGHDHNYERFAPQTPAGELDPEFGIRQFVVGTGGASLRGMNAPLPNSEAQRAWEHGVLQLTLHPDRYDWEFLSVSGEYSDAGSTPCHDAP